MQNSLPCGSKRSFNSFGSVHWVVFHHEIYIPNCSPLSLRECFCGNSYGCGWKVCSWHSWVRKHCRCRKKPLFIGSQRSLPNPSIIMRLPQPGGERVDAQAGNGAFSPREWFSCLIKQRIHDCILIFHGTCIVCYTRCCWWCSACTHSQQGFVHDVLYRYLETPRSALSRARGAKPLKSDLGDRATMIILVNGAVAASTGSLRWKREMRESSLVH